MKKICKIVLFIIAFVITTFVVTAQSRWGVLAVLDRWAVDSGKHMDWSGSTSYSSQWNAGVNVWNTYKPGVIRPDAWNTVNDVTIKDVSYIAPNVPAQTVMYSTGKSNATISFATNLMNNLSSMQKKIVCTHEIGHALGLDENNDLGTQLIMYQDIATNTSNNVLNSNDKANYDYMYNNKY